MNNSYCCYRRNCNGSLVAFTLVEVLVIITIIAILAGLVLNVVASGKERAKMDVSASNLRQIALATTIYAGNYNEVLPFYRNDELYLRNWDPGVTTFGIPTDSKQPRKLVECLDPYLSHAKQIWFSPGDAYAHTNGTFGFINHLWTSYHYLALPIGYSSERGQPFPLVTSFANVDPNIALFSEVADMDGKDLKGYWSRNVAVNVMPDTHIVYHKFGR